MSFFSSTTNIFRSFTAQASKAGQSFKSLVSTVQQYIPYTPSFKSRRIKEESDQWNTVRKFNPHLNKNQFLPKENQVRTTANLSKKYQYLFEMDITFENGLKRADPTVSLLSSKRLTPAEAQSQLIKQILENEQNYGWKIIDITDIEMQAERLEYFT